MVVSARSAECDSDWADSGVPIAVQRRRKEVGLMGSIDSDGRMIHLCAFLQAVGHLPSAWRHPSTNPEGVDGLEHWARLANVAERGLFDAVFLADQLVVNDFGIRL